MKIVLVNPPRTNFDQEELAPPLGLMRLAQVAELCGWNTVIDDYNLLWHLDDRFHGQFYDAAVERLLDYDAEIYGFTSMAVDSHVALELGRRIKEALPSARVILGGAHFTSIAHLVRDYFPWIDAVLCGEAEQALADTLKPGVRVEPDDLLLTPYLWDLVHLPAYFHVNPRCLVNMETGRGCRFKCSFCYSPKHYAKVRNFSIESVLSQMASLPQMGVKHSWFIEDNFLNEPARAKELCRELEALKSGISFSCYGTFPQLDEEMMTSLSRAGCDEVFCGLDAVGYVAEHAFQKAFLRGPTPMVRKIQQLKDLGIKPTFAFLAAPPSHEAGSSYEQTLKTALEAQAAGADTLLNPLSLYSGTVALRKTARHFEADPLQAELMMDVPKVTAENLLAEIWPEIFPFHSRFTSRDEWHGFLSHTHCAATLIHSYPSTMSALFENSGISPGQIAQQTLDCYEGWEAVPKRERRVVEQDIGFAILEEFAGSSEAGILLDAERSSLKTECTPV